jgi:hypothetical protein
MQPPVPENNFKGKIINSIYSFLQKYVLPFNFIILSLIWFAVPLATSFLSEWNSIAINYPLKEKYKEDRLFFQNVQFGLILYTKWVTVGADKSGLFLEVAPLVSFAHPPISIPWSDISTRKVSTIPLFPDIELKLSKVPSASIRIYQSQEDWIKHKVGDSWPNER